jgi:NAD(P)-dependent dehydrogenase (short-subunit alcohol dehydrogenase family)
LIPTDVSDGEQVERAFAQILEDPHRIDVLTNSADTVARKQPPDFAAIDRIIDTNPKGTI